LVPRRDISEIASRIRGWRTRRHDRGATCDNYQDSGEIEAMTTLTIHPETKASAPILTTSDPQRIREELEKVGVRFERWRAAVDLSPTADQEATLAAYAVDIEHLKTERGCQAVDVLRMRPEHPDRKGARAKFLAEHTHDDDEIRFFVEGSGAFFVHAGNRVLEIVCERDDLISVPAGAKHWFDMGERPNFTTIRMFTRPDGWVASFSGDNIATQFVREPA
jgi:1,2-dihydroxy-3-keto-5-methylthiopentene dioxygenase